MWFAIAGLLVSAIYGWVFYQAVINHSVTCAIICAVSFGLYEGDRFYKSEIVRGFVAGITGSSHDR